MNYYEVLGVSKTATIDEIKKAYRKKSKETHPDLHKNDPEAESNFKKISEAYEVLSDVNKRASYDNPRQSNPFNIFGDIFNNFNARSRGSNGENIGVQVELELVDVLKGCNRTINIARKGRCGTCKGSGGNVITCARCQGQGVTMHRANNLLVQATCPDCSGAGQIIKDRCMDCLGTGLSPATEVSLSIDINPGARSGMNIMIPGQGNPGRNGGPNGNVILNITVKEHEFYKATDYGNLEIQVPVTYSQLVKGCEIEISTLEGKKLIFDLPPGSKSNSKFSLAKQGLPLQFMQHSDRGDLIASIFVEVPSNVNKEYIDLIEKLESLDISYPEIEKFNNFAKKL